MKKRRIKTEYIPVIMSLVTLMLLIIALIVVLLWQKKDFDVTVPNQEYITNEFIVDTSNSTCDKKEKQDMYDKVNKVAVSYTPIEVVVGKGQDQETLEEVDTYGHVFNVYFSNVTEDMYLIVKSDNINTLKEEMRLEYNDSRHGLVKYQTEYTELVVEYTVEIYSNKKGCKDELYRKFTFTTPIYNRYYNMDICASYPEFELCKEYITENKPSMQEFFRRLYNWGEKQDITITNLYDVIYGTTKKTTSKTSTTAKDEEKEKTENQAKEDKVIYVISAIGALLITISITVVIFKKKRN